VSSLDLALIVVVATLAALVGGLIARRRLGPRRLASRGGRRVLVPFSGRLDPIVLDAFLEALDSAPPRPPIATKALR